MRSLARIRRITDIQPIEGRDRIALATVDGWKVIIRKQEFEVGSYCVYCEIDSVLPERPEFEFMRDKKFRVRTIKMAGVYSQGICFPTSILPEGFKFTEGQDVTEVLGVTQYEPTMDKGTEALLDTYKRKYPSWMMRIKWLRKLLLPKKNSQEFPNFIRKTDEERIQNIPFILTKEDDFGNRLCWMMTEKVDGQSGTFVLKRIRKKSMFSNKKFEFIVCSRNRRIPKEDNSSYWSVARKYHIESVLRSVIEDYEWVAIQGECIGPGIQKNKYNRDDYELYVFNLIYPNGRTDSFHSNIVCRRYGLKHVPIIGYNGNYFGSLPDTVDDVLKMADGESALEPGVLREGIVFRTIDGKQSFKAVSNQFLTKWNE